MLHPDCQEKILKLADGESIRRNFLDLFTAIANDADQQNLPNATYVFPFYDEHSGLQPDDWAAELHFVVRQVESVDGQETSQGN